MPRTIGRGLRGVAVMAALSSAGCIALPLPPISYNSGKPIPSVVPHLHEDLRASTDEVLVLVELEVIPVGRNVTSTRRVSPHFYKASELENLGAEVPLKSVGLGWGWVVVVGGTPPRNGIEAGDWPVDSHAHARVVCIVVPDGRTIRLALNAWNDGYIQMDGELLAETRDRVAAGLRSAQSGKPDWLIGPCDLKGYIDWSDALRSRVADYLTAIKLQ